MLNEEYRNKLMDDRMRTLVLTWALLAAKVNLPYNRLFTLNHSIASRVIRHYVGDLDVLKMRYNIPNRVQTPKIAGLMANAILKYRPLVPTNGKQKDIDNNEVNEYLAAFHGIFVCANFQNNGFQAMVDLVGRPFFDAWLKRFIYLLRDRNYTSESLIMTFETLCLAAFPDAIEYKALHL
jgi:hypothetical protein